MDCCEVELFRPRKSGMQDYQRLRADHLSEAASQVQKMQQALERMNIKFHDVISDLTGVSGMKVIKAILAGERQPERLLELCDKQIQKKKSERVLESCTSLGSGAFVCSGAGAVGLGFIRNSWPSAIGKSSGAEGFGGSPPPASPPSSSEGREPRQSAQATW